MFNHFIGYSYVITVILCWVLPRSVCSLIRRVGLNYFLSKINFSAVLQREGSDLIMMVDRKGQWALMHACAGNATIKFQFRTEKSIRSNHRINYGWLVRIMGIFLLNYFLWDRVHLMFKFLLIVLQWTIIISSC